MFSQGPDGISSSPSQYSCWGANRLGVPLDRRLTQSAHVDQVRQKSAQVKIVLCPLLNRICGLPVRNGVLLYKRHRMDWACPMWMVTARTHAGRLEVSKCLAAGTPWYISNRQIHKGLGGHPLPTTSEP
jgi:hypothetical protein